MPFEKGQSGNPGGRPPGARNRATIIAESLLQGETETITRLAIERAKTGDMAALRLCLDRVAPPLRHRAIRLGNARSEHNKSGLRRMAKVAGALRVFRVGPKHKVAARQPGESCSEHHLPLTVCFA